MFCRNRIGRSITPLPSTSPSRSQNRIMSSSPELVPTSSLHTRTRARGRHVRIMRKLTCTHECERIAHTGGLAIDRSPEVISNATIYKQERKGGPDLGGGVTPTIDREPASPRIHTRESRNRRTQTTPIVQTQQHTVPYGHVRTSNDSRAAFAQFSPLNTANRLTDAPKFEPSETRRSAPTRSPSAHAPLSRRLRDTSSRTFRP